MTINNVYFNLTSANSTQIYFPCQISNDLNWEAVKALWENGKDIQDMRVTTHWKPMRMSGYIQ